MTLARTALRFATVAALRGSSGNTGPTIAHNRVYDSRVDDFSPETYPKDALPSIIVLTDEDEGDALSDQNGGPPFRRNIALVMEFAMVQGFEEHFEEDGITKSEFIPGYPATDSEHEASLDVLEFQIKRRLSEDLSAMPALWRSLGRVWKFDCHRQVVDNSGVKLAARVLTWQCEVPDDDVAIINPAIDDIPTGFAALPDPLRTVAYALPVGALRDKCTSIANAIVPLQADPFDGMDIKVSEGDQDINDMLDVKIEIVSSQDTPQVVVAAGIGEIDYARGTFQNLILASNVTQLTIINWPKSGKTGRLILKVTNTGNYDIAPTAWPAGTLWKDGNEPSITQGAGKIDMLVLVSGSAGAETFGNIIGQDYSA